MKKRGSKYQATAQEVYDLLVNEFKIKSQDGRIYFSLGQVDIVVKQRDVVGNIMQEWLQEWLIKNNILFTTNDNMQMPPDFYLNPSDKTTGMLEVKAFNRSAGPGFDIADFRMYAEELLNKPYVLDVDYLIFGYDMSDEGIVTIKDVWLKKVWKITRRMKDYPINLQVKEKVIHKIRPGIWYTEGPVDFSIFESKEDFICAFEETVFKDPRLRSTIAPTWLEVFNRNYKEYYGETLDIPRWRDIADKYDQKTARQRTKAEEELKKAKKAYEDVLKRKEKIETALSSSVAEDKERRKELLYAKKDIEADIEKAKTKLDKKQEAYNKLKP